MNWHYLYLIINAAVILPPLLLSFDKKVAFFKHWKTFFFALLPVIIPFLIWDANFFANGVWGFNEEYITGVYFFGLPIEEILFFLTIPYSCVFTHYCIKAYTNWSLNIKLSRILKLMIGLTLLSLSIIFSDKSYTLIVCLSLALVLLLSLTMKVDAFRTIIFSYIILCLPFALTNGILTGTGIDGEIVWYNNEENLGLRLLTIPVEDFAYFMLLFYPVILIMEIFETKKASNTLKINRLNLSSKNI
ncbi:MAG: lycopene cyclase domain-containing protein [Flavobacteriales bacterium]|nr:lycopene cyclase domain-containing protein [Flavobacteriales bacterium]